MAGHCPPVEACVSMLSPTVGNGGPAPRDAGTDGGAVLPEDDHKDEPCEPTGAEGPDEGARNDNSESIDSTEFNGAVYVFTSGAASKFAQSLPLDVVNCTEEASVATCLA